MGMSTWSPTDNYNHCVSVRLSFSPVSLSSIMAVPSSSSNLLILLLISSLDWLSTPGSAFYMGRDHMTPSGRLLVSLLLCVRTNKLKK